MVEHNDDDDGLFQVEWQTDSRVGSRKNIQHRAGGGDVKVESFFQLGSFTIMRQLFFIPEILIHVSFRFSTKKWRWSAKARWVQDHRNFDSGKYLSKANAGI